MIDIQIDGVWCPQCKTLHPTLRWHEKYNDWLVERKSKHQEICKRFGISNIYYLDGLDVEESDIKNCVVCGYETNYIDKQTGNPVCSDKCKYNNRNIKNIL